MTMLILSANQVRELLPMKEAIAVNKIASRLHTAGKSEVPIRPGFTVEGEGSVLFMPAYVKGDVNAIGVKIVSVFPKNSSAGLPVVPAQMLLIDTNTGVVSAMMNGVELTRIRTGAISGAATDILAKEDASIAALFGTGGQASSQLEAILCVRQLREVRIWDTATERTKEFIRTNEDLADRYGARLFAASSPEAAIDGAEIITTVTTSAEPVFNGEQVAKGTHVNGVGSFTPDRRELDETLLTKARVFVDNREAVLAEAGDFLIPAGRGTYDMARIAGEIGEVLAGQIAGRTSPEEITVLKTVGYAVLDVVTADVIYSNARARGVGQEIEI